MADLLFELIGDFVNGVVNGMLDAVFSPIRQLLTNALKQMFQVFENLMVSSANMICNGGATNATLQNIASVVNDAIKPTAWTLLTIFFLVEIYDLWQRKQNDIDYVDIIKALIKLFIVKNLITITPFLLECIRNTTAPVYQKLVTDGNPAGNLSNLAETLANACMGGSGELFAFLFGLIVSIIYMILGIYIYCVIYIRDFEIAILEALASIPIIFYVFSETKDITKRFIFAYASVAMQGLVILINFIMFQSLLLDALSHGVTDVVVAGVIAFMGMKKSAEWAGRILGM